MAFVIFFFISWFVIALFAVTKKSLSLSANTFVFLVVLIFSVNFTWIIVDEFEWVTVAEKALPYTAYLLTRTIIVPFVLLLHVNFYNNAGNTSKKVIVILAAVISLLFVSVLSRSLGITEYMEWNYGYSALYYLFLNGVAILTSKLYKWLSRNEVSFS
ncbi:hypothetical protein LS684_04775 [Cytobacillus spongiae]|uniref:hypothetical protein n=1 Tax=Cytobacillus spongiae TaxID=2901381 RepID=UPI001F3DF1E0|nr:hypothetical protein [Cytobacillus spongiae]UII56785.1 hypothetical protein LS684_04775 [Cytobacillus spongiae]